MSGGASHNRRDYNRQWAADNPDRVKSLNRKKTLRVYDMTEEEFEKRLLAQNGRCAVCDSPTPGGRWKQWHVDHDHAAETIGIMHVRGLVCDSCNRTIGHAKESPRILRRAASYLEENNMNTDSKAVNF